MAARKKAGEAEGSDSKALIERPDMSVLAGQYGEEAGQGFEGQTSEDIALPFIALLQDLSPQVTNPPEEGGLKEKGAKAGGFFNTVSEEIFDEVQFVPAMTEHVYVEWIPRDQGGGFVGVHTIDSQVVKDARAGGSFGAYSTKYDKAGKPIGNDLVQTFYVYGAALDTFGDWQPAVIAFTSTKIKKYRTWNTNMQKFQIPVGNEGKRITPPMFAHLTLIRSVSEVNRNRQRYYNFQIGPAVDGDRSKSLIPTDHPGYIAAKKVREMVHSGLARASYETQERAASAGDGPAPEDGSDGEDAF